MTGWRGRSGPPVIEELRIRGLGVIDDAVLELDPGLTVVTGETGAGKTMVVTGLGLLLGGRADAAAVRTGAGRALVEGRVRIDAAGAGARAPPRRPAPSWTTVRSCWPAPSRPRVARGPGSAAARSRSAPSSTSAPSWWPCTGSPTSWPCWLRPDSAPPWTGTPAQPSAPRCARTPRRTRGGRRSRTSSRPSAPSGPGGGRRRRCSGSAWTGSPLWLRPPDEDADLDAEVSRLEHADALRTAASTAHAALLGDPESDDADALALVAAARRALEHERDHDPQLGALADRLAEVAALVAQAGRRPRLVPGRRRRRPGPARGRARATRCPAGAHPDVRPRPGGRAGLGRRRPPSGWRVLDADDQRVDELAAQASALRARLADLAGAVSVARRAAAESFAAAVSDELRDLAMPDARVTAALEQADDPDGLDGGPAGAPGRRLRFGPHGVDDVTLLLAAHQGAPARPLARGASGGELSRVMLAIEVVFAGADPVPTLVFDEVDAGVGGKAAVEVGLRLARLARTAQVLVVTHLPQVAAFADRHLRVQKSSEGAVTSSDVTVLDDAGRVDELTRMLAGLEGSRSGRAHAQELLRTAAAAKVP